MQSFRSAGYTIGCSLNWVGMCVLGMLFPIIVVSTLLSWYNLGYFNNRIQYSSEIRWSLTPIYKCPPKCFLCRRNWNTFVFSYSWFSVLAVGCMWSSTSLRPRIVQCWRLLQSLRGCTANLKYHRGKHPLNRNSAEWKHTTPSSDYIHWGLKVTNSKHLEDFNSLNVTKAEIPTELYTMRLIKVAFLSFCMCLFCVCVVNSYLLIPIGSVDRLGCVHLCPFSLKQGLVLEVISGLWLYR